MSDKRAPNRQVGHKPGVLAHGAAVGAWLALAMGLGACGAAASPMDLAMAPPMPPGDVSEQQAAEAPPIELTASGAGPSAQQPGASASQAKSTALEDSSTEKNPDPLAGVLLIYEAQVGLSVPEKELVVRIDSITDLAERLGGYLVSQEPQRVVVRVPSARFREALNGLADAGEVTSRHVSAQDVSEEFHDLGVQLQNLKAVRARLEQLLAKANTVDEALRVGQQLDQVGAQIDRISGRMKFLETRARFSLIDVRLSPRPELKPMVEPEPAPPPAPRELNLPVDWLDETSVDRLLNL